MRRHRFPTKVAGAAGQGLAITHIAHQFNLLTDHEEANDSDQSNGNDDQTKKVNQKIIPDLVIDGRTLLCAFDGIGTQLFGGC